MENSEENTEGSLTAQFLPGGELGVYADGAIVHHTPHGFCLDFIQQFPNEDPEHQICLVASRVHMSPLMMQQLMDVLKANWEKYAEKAMPID